MTGMPAANWTDGEVPATLRASQLLEWGVTRLREVKIESAPLDARLLMQHALGVSREALLRDDVPVSDSAVALFDALISRRVQNEPVAKILKRKAFWKHDFIVSSATLDPRPDSETLIEAALAYFPTSQPPLRLLDLGTGTGCLLLSLLAEYPQATGLGVDISEQALKVAGENARLLGVEHRTEYRLSNWCEQVSGTFDLIVCNPPYIAESDADTLAAEVRRHDPSVALFGGEDGLQAYRCVLPQAMARLMQDGIMIIEIGAGQAEAVSAIAHSAGFTLREARKDLAGITRALVLAKEGSDKR